jgi:hypothetical protein
MRDVVLPAIDATDKVALEQAQLVIGMLVLLENTLPLAFRYDRDELSRTLKLASTLQKEYASIGDGGLIIDALAASASAAEDVLDRAKAEPRELEVAVGDLRAKIGALITATYAQASAPARNIVSRAVLAIAKDQLLRERAWVVCQGWESNPGSLPPIETMI